MAVTRTAGIMTRMIMIHDSDDDSETEGPLAAAAAANGTTRRAIMIAGKN